ncbi:MAG TPA: hypothetical protein VF331_13465 [Polyangiales bacterium]
MPALRVWPVLQASFGLLRARPVVTLALGTAIVLSLSSVCCGLGLITTPWFMCELFALQLAQASGAAVSRTLSWIAASLLLLGAVLLVCAVAGLTLLGTAPELLVFEAEPLGLSLLARSTPFYALLASGVAVMFVLPFLFAPLILIEHAASLDSAVLESARRVMAGGPGQHARLSLAAHALQVAPPALVALATALIDPGSVPLAALCTVPLLCVTVPLGQGMIVCAYVQGRTARSGSEPSEPDLSHAASAPCAAEQRAHRLTKRSTLAFLGLALLPMLSLLLLGASLVRPSRVARGTAPTGVLVAELVVRTPRAQRMVLPGTALEVVVSPGSVRVVASDGGGVGELSLRSGQPIERVRVLRVRDAYAIEVHQLGARSSVATVDRSGVRLDDDLRVRMVDRVVPWGLGVVLLALVLTAVLTLPVLDGLARARLAHALPHGYRPAADVLELELRRSLRRVGVAGALLWPLSLAAVVVGLRALGVL